MILVRVVLPALYVLMLSLSNARAEEPTASLKDCQRWEEQIDRYTGLRRRGGSARQMEEWKRARREHEDKFRAHNCLDYGSKLL